MIHIVEHDLPTFALDQAGMNKTVGCDTETTGLDPIGCDPKLFQLSTGSNTFLVRLDKTLPENIRWVLENRFVTKIFHHAMFDLKFMRHHYAIQARNIVCTKVAVKLLDPSKEKYKSHSLKTLVNYYFGIELDKSLAVSDWGGTLSQEQINYVTKDSELLLPLWDKLKYELSFYGLATKAQKAFSLLPARVEMELNDLTEVYGY